MNDLQNFVNNSKSVHPFDKYQTKTFLDFWVYEYGLWQKHENPKMLIFEIAKQLLKSNQFGM